MSENQAAAADSSLNSTPDPAMLTELPAVAKNIHLPCKKCGVDRYHVVVAHTSATAAKVKCEVCGAQKTFKLTKAKAAKAAKSPKAKTVGTRSKRNEPDHGAIWTDLKSQIGLDKILPYNMRTKFGLANAIQHPKFGVGFVTNMTPEKVDVQFQDGGRALVHNRP